MYRWMVRIYRRDSRVHTAAYYLPSEDATIIVFVNSQREAPEPGVANVIFRDTTRISFPANVAYSGMTTSQ
jgi:hypothetical protein